MDRAGNSQNPRQEIAPRWFDCTHFSWKGSPIKDIHQWCRDRGEKMVRYEYDVDFFGEIQTGMGEMPESFYDNQCFTDNRREVERYNP